MFSVRQKLKLVKFHVPVGVTATKKRLVCLEGGSDFVECELRNGNGNTKVERRREEESKEWDVVR